MKRKKNSLFCEFPKLYCIVTGVTDYTDYTIVYCLIIQEKSAKQKTNFFFYPEHII